ncbi:MAG TPA: helicase [Desulfobacteraceae bacterium]|nr:helicase [Desulfobacteraceae bacterium]
MFELDVDFIRDHVADTPVIFKRGMAIYEYGAFFLDEADRNSGRFVYEVDGNYGDYTTSVQLLEDSVETSCNCPYPGTGCKHTVAVLFDVIRIITDRDVAGAACVPESSVPAEPYLTPEEIKAQALEDRRQRARSEHFSITEGEMLKGEHLVETSAGRQYTVTLHDPSTGKGHCTCPDFCTSGLGTCKHMIHLTDSFKKKENFARSIHEERFPFVDIFWDSSENRPRLFMEKTRTELGDLYDLLESRFDRDGRYKSDAPADLVQLLFALGNHKMVRIQDEVLLRLNRCVEELQLAEMQTESVIPKTGLKADLYPYQSEGVRFGLFKQAALIGDEMGLGKTLQAIDLALAKKQVFGFSKVLVITLASLKDQWKREIERFSGASAVVIAGPARRRRALYMNNGDYFKITNYEAVLRDSTVISRLKPDLIILDEAQRIKNFSTKTADAVKQLPRKHALVLTGTPLENKLEDVYSIVQFLDPFLLAPLWRFAADHFMLSRERKGRVVGYRNLDLLREKLGPIVIRRRKEEVLSDLPDEIVNNYYIDLHEKQRKIHAGYLQALVPLLAKKYLTPMDIKQIQELFLKMRMVCNSTYLIDRKTLISPKLKELEGIIDELVVQNRRKMVVFSEWTTMTYLIARSLSMMKIPFVELSGKVPVQKRQALIDEFSSNPDCRVFLSTDAGGTGLNLQAADCVVNFELPWNPARLNQRVGRVNRIGQKSRCVNVVNLISKNSIEEKIFAGIQLKTDLFKGVFEDGENQVEFSHEKRTEMLNRLREMMGEELVSPSPEAAPSVEIPEDTPYYMNPEVLRDKDEETDFVSEERDTSQVVSEQPAQKPAEFTLSDQPPEKIENVLNSGMQFIGGLLEMVTGKKMEVTGGDDRMVRIDKTTGEVTMKFKLPGF